MRDKLEESIKSKAYWVLSRMKDMTVGEYDFIIAGGCLTGKVNDVDIFPVCAGDFEALAKDFERTGEVVGKTKNAVTYTASPWPVQVCSYCRSTLGELVESFDYSHIKAGVLVEHDGFRNSIKEVYVSNDLVESRLTQTVRFTGSEYPLSSLIRVGKYYKRGAIGKGDYIGSVLGCVTAIVDRGFRGYDDFKDQLDAVDLGLLPEEMQGLCTHEIGRLFALLDRRC